MSQTMTSVELLASIGAQWYEQLLILMEIHTKHSQCCTQSRVSPQSQYWFHMQILCSYSNTWFAINEMNTSSPASKYNNLRLQISETPKYIYLNVRKTQKFFQVCAMQIQQEHAKSLLWRQTTIKPCRND